jgi:hypothetical protein
MARVVGAPYLRASGDSVGCSFLVDGITDDGVLPGFSYQAELQVSWRGRIDLAKFRGETGLVAGARCKAVLHCVSEPVGLVLPITSHEFGLEGDETTVSLVGVVAGEQLGDSATLITVVSLVEQGIGRNSSPLSAKRQGSVLWEDSRSVRMRGTGGTMAVHSQDFEEGGLPVSADAPWYLECRSLLLDAAAASSVVLFVNTRFPEVVVALENRKMGGQPSPLAAEVYADVEMQLIRRAVTETELEETGDYPAGSIGKILLQHAQRTNYSLDELRELSANHPDRFEALLLGFCRGRLLKQRALA